MRSGLRAAPVVLALCLCMAHAAGAKVKLAVPFADGMVLQRDCPVPVWGTAAAGERVRVAFAGQVKETVAGKDGSWRVDLDSLAASAEGRVLTVNELSVGDVVVGEVWLCSGQSNMAMSLAIGRTRYGDGIGAMVAQTTDKPSVRYMDAAPGARGWNRLTPSFLSSRWIAALPVHYAVELHDKLGVPVGVIVAAVGGSNIDSWNPSNGKNANLYASQVAPLGPFALRGVVWYQGETNVYKFESGVYPRKLGELHTGLARQFARACLPFYIVQLAPCRYNSPEATAELPAFMEAQAAYAAKTPSAAITVINDIGNFEDIHPNNKWLVAKRLALHAYRREYGFRNVEDESPSPAAATLVSSNMVRIAFNHAKSLYVYRADSRFDLYAGFELAGADGVWKKAGIVNFPALGWMQHGVLTNNFVDLVAKGVDRPVEVRHAYAEPFAGCLYNQVNLPCGPFRMRVSPAAPLWIRPAAEASTNANVAVFRREVRVERDVARAEWRVASLGALEARVNGTVVSGFLDPGFTQPEKTRFEVAYDVTAAVRRGVNVFEAVVAPSWWRCRMTRRAYPKVGAPLPSNAALRATLRLTYVDGGTEELATDRSWLSAYSGPVVDAGIYEGERVDARRTAEGLAQSVFCDDFAGEVVPRRGPPVLLREDLVLRPAAAYVWSGTEGASDAAFGRVVVRRRCESGGPVALEPGETLVVDFGQNCAAVPRFEMEGPAGAEMTVRMGEALNDANGEKSRRCDGPAGSVLLSNLRSAKASIRYVFRDGRQSYRPSFTFFGYRYASVTVTAPVKIVSVESVPVTSVSAADESPVIVTDNPKVNRLAENVRWGFRSNYLEIPTDCPQRDERLGWTADTLAFVSAAEYSADVRGLLGKWLGDLRDSQGDDGTFPTLSPLVWAFHGDGAVTGWSDAGVLVPHRLWKRYGDRALLDAHWPAMTRYMDFIAARRGPDKQHYGDWQAFEHAIAGEGPALGSPAEYRECFRGFFFVWDAQAMKEMAQDLGKADEAARYAKLEAEARAEFRERYIGLDGLMHERYRGQTTDLFMLKLGLAEGEAAARVKEHLLSDIRRHGDCLQTGFLGTMILMETLTDIGASDVAYTLLLQEKCPSWLFAVDNGATTVWERWDCYDREKGFQDPGMNSMNHYAYGAVYSWMMSTMAGIREDPASPGMRHFVLAPVPDRRIGSVKAAYAAPCGRIESEWRWRGDRCAWRFRIPEGASATVRFCGLPPREFAAGEHTLEAK